MGAMLALAMAGGQAAALPPPLDRFVRAELEVSRYRHAEADLDGDGTPEALILARDPGFCGSGGCALFVVARTGTRYRLVSRTTIVHAPVRLLATSSHGWRDLEVTVAGGGVRQARQVRLRFDGRRYPANPSIVAVQSDAHGAGAVLIAPE